MITAKIFLKIKKSQYNIVTFKVHTRTREKLDMSVFFMVQCSYTERRNMFICLKPIYIAVNHCVTLLRDVA